MTATASAALPASSARRRLLAPLSSSTGRVQAVGLIILGILVCMAVFAPLLSPYGPSDPVCEPFLEPEGGHPLGCNDAGQDLWSQLLYGTRVSLTVGVIVAGLSTLIATLLALVAGYSAGSVEARGGGRKGGWLDQIIMRVVDVSLALPFLPLVIVLGVYFGASVQTQIIVITVVMWAYPVRELRAQVLSIRSMTYVEASKSMGAGGIFIGLRHILPELAPLIVPQFVRIAHNAILVEASLSFLGLGDPLQNSWGSTLFHANARAAFLTGSWTWWIVPPGLAIGFTVLSFAFIGYGFDASLGKPRRKISAGERQRLRPEVLDDPARDAALLSIRGLSVDYPTDSGAVHAVRAVDLDIAPGELLGLVGESGSGKTSLGMAVLRLLRDPAQISAGSVRFDGQKLLDLDAEDMRRLRRNRISLIPQSAMNALNPVMTIGDQIGEALQLADVSADERRSESVTWMERVGLGEEHLVYYPHELSGGMRQRAVIAIALCRRPDFVVADEPTTGLDVLVQEEIMQLLIRLRRDLGLTVLFVTHNLPLIARHSDRLAVMLDGRIVDDGTPAGLRQTPGHSHTKALFDSMPELSGERRWLRDGETSAVHNEPVLELANVGKLFGSHGRFSRKAPFRAVDDVSLTLRPGDTLGLVGASGAGKSTIARLVMGLINPEEGIVRCRGTDRQDMGSEAGRKASRAVHMVFQDPYQSLNNRLTILDIVAEPLRIDGRRISGGEIEEVRAALRAVQLPDDDEFLARLPVFLSGGQRQRVAFARAIICRPDVIIADEPTSMLDQSIRLGIMELMESLRKDYGTAFLFITHDIVLARHFCERLIVLRNGQVVEEGPADRVLQAPEHDYTRALIAAV